MAESAAKLLLGQCNISQQTPVMTPTFGLRFDLNFLISLSSKEKLQPVPLIWSLDIRSFRI